MVLIPIAYIKYIENIPDCSRTLYFQEIIFFKGNIPIFIGTFLPQKLFNIPVRSNLFQEIFLVPVDLTLGIPFFLGDGGKMPFSMPRLQFSFPPCPGKWKKDCETFPQQGEEKQQKRYYFHISWMLVSRLLDHWHTNGYVSRQSGPVFFIPTTGKE